MHRSQGDIHLVEASPAVETWGWLASNKGVACCWFVGSLNLNNSLMISGVTFIFHTILLLIFYWLTFLKFQSVFVVKLNFDKDCELNFKFQLFQGFSFMLLFRYTSEQRKVTNW